MADSTKTHGGKSVSMLTKQRNRLDKKFDERIERAKQRGASQEEIDKMEATKGKVINRANMYIDAARKAVGTSHAEDRKLARQGKSNQKNWKRVDRSVYTKGKLGKSDEGQRGQYRDFVSRSYRDTRFGGNTNGTAARRAARKAAGFFVPKS